MAIHHTLKMSNIDYPNELVHIFTDSLNSIYLLLTPKVLLSFVGTIWTSGRLVQFLFMS